MLAERGAGTPLAREAKGLPDWRWLASGLLANPAPAYAPHKAIGKLVRGREVGLAAADLPIQERPWMAGDALVGPSTVVEAMAHGRRAAAAVLAARPSRGGRGNRARFSWHTTAWQDGPPAPPF